VSVGLILVIAALTYASRALALVFMPHPPPRIQAVLDRIPGPLFASLAALSLIEEGKLVGPEPLAAAVGALLVAPTRSLLWVLLGGLAGYALGGALFT
jgi:branched-subunit amino acid transport protein